MICGFQDCNCEDCLRNVTLSVWEICRSRARVGAMCRCKRGGVVAECSCWAPSLLMGSQSGSLENCLEEKKAWAAWSMVGGKGYFTHDCASTVLRLCADCVVSLKPRLCYFRLNDTRPSLIHTYRIVLLPCSDRVALDCFESDFSLPLHSQGTVLYVWIEIRRSVDGLWVTCGLSKRVLTGSAYSGCHATSGRFVSRMLISQEIKLQLGRKSILNFSGHHAEFRRTLCSAKLNVRKRHRLSTVGA